MTKHEHKWELVKYQDNTIVFRPQLNGTTETVFTDKPDQATWVCICGKRKVVTYDD